MWLPRRLPQAIAGIRERLGGAIDLRVQHVAMGPRAWRAALVFLDTTTDREALFQTVGRAVAAARWPEPVPVTPSLVWLARRVLGIMAGRRVRTVDEAARDLIEGKALLMVDGVEGALALEARGWKSRDVGEPDIESTVRGSREGFVEVLETNLGILRRTLRTPDLRLERLELGSVSRTEVVIAYLAGRADPQVVAEVRRRLQGVRSDAILESRTIEEYLAEERWSPFPLLDHTQRPDRVTAALLEGRVAVLTAGTPFVLLAPTTVWHLLQSPEDYAMPPLFSLFTRTMRAVALVMVVVIPSLYVALTTFHHEMVPTPLALSLAALRRQVPFPALVEVVIIELTFEVMREGGLRLPRPVATTITIIGSLLLGEAAFRSGLVSPMMIIVVAITGVASFTIPSYALAIAVRLVRLGFMLVAGFAGLFGVMVLSSTLTLHLAGLRSFGVPYLAPLAPVRRGEAGDVLLRPPAPALPTGPIRPQSARPLRPMGHGGGPGRGR